MRDLMQNYIQEHPNASEAEKLAYAGVVAKLLNAREHAKKAPMIRSLIKTTTFINPMIQCIAATNCGSSMIMTDPKGELFDLHSGFLKERAYVDVTVESEAYDPVAKRIEEVRAQVQADLRRRQQEVEGGEST